MPSQNAAPQRDPTRRPSQAPRDDDDPFPPLPPARWLPPVGPGPSRLRRFQTSAYAPAQTPAERQSNNYIAQISDALASIREIGRGSTSAINSLREHLNLNDPAPQQQQQPQLTSTQQADRDYFARYENLLSDAHELSLPLFDPTASIRFHEQQQSIRRELANSIDLLMERQDSNASQSYHSSLLARSEEDRRRPRAGYGTVRVSHDPPLDDDEDDLDAVRAMWNRRTQHASSPFSPPHPSALSPLDMSSAARPPDYSEDSRRAKRRKLDSDRIAPSFKGFEYGKYGQVEPGELTMEIVSCDGGLYSNESSYACENILKNDNSVYCTKSSRCNIVLRHQGATAFSLKEIVIKAPASHNYNAPVREGMIFVSMNQDELLQRTAQYQIQYASTRSGGRGREAAPIAPVISIRHHDDGTTITRTQPRARRIYGLTGEEEDDAQRTAQMPPEFRTDPPPFNITTECDDDDSDDDDTPRMPPNRRAPNRIGALPFESDSDEESNPFANDDYGLDDVWAPSLRRRDTQNMTLTEALEASSQSAPQQTQPQPQQQQQQAARPSGEYELMGPLAKFFIEKDKNKCTIRFEPPVSGRFILLKMWSPNRETGSNIDIQGVVAHGYAGPRYFPAVQLR